MRCWPSTIESSVEDESASGCTTSSYKIVPEKCPSSLVAARWMSSHSSWHWRSCHEYLRWYLGMVNLVSGIAMKSKSDDRVTSIAGLLNY